MLNAYEGGALQICEDIKCVIQLWKDILADRFCQEGVVFLAALQEKNREILMREKESYQISKNLRNIENAYAQLCEQNFYNSK